MLYCIVLVKKMDIPDIGISQFMSKKENIVLDNPKFVRDIGTTMDILKIVNYI